MRTIFLVISLLLSFPGANSSSAQGEHSYLVFVDRTADFTSPIFLSPDIESQFTKIWVLRNKIPEIKEHIEGMRIETFDSIDSLVARTRPMDPIDALIAVETKDFATRLVASQNLRVNDLVSYNFVSSMNIPLRTLLWELIELSRVRFEGAPLTQNWKKRILSLEDLYFSYLTQSKEETFKIATSYLEILKKNNDILVQWLSSSRRSLTLLNALSRAIDADPANITGASELLKIALYEIASPREDIREHAITFFEELFLKTSKDRIYKDFENLLIELLANKTSFEDRATSKSLNLPIPEGVSKTLIRKSSLRLLTNFLVNSADGKSDLLWHSIISLIRRMSSEESLDINDKNVALLDSLIAKEAPLLRADYEKVRGRMVVGMCGGPKGILTGGQSN